MLQYRITNMRNLRAALLIFVATVASAAAPDFPAVNDWKNALLSGNATDFRSLYSTKPPARFAEGNNPAQDISKEIDFWQQIKQSGAQDLQVTLTNSENQQGLQIVGFNASYRIRTPAGPRTRYVSEKQAWMQQGITWRVVIATHSGILKMPQPTNLNTVLYPKNVDAKAEIREAVARAAREHKRVILVFGADWCFDCKVLEFALHHSDAATEAQHFVIVHIDIGEGELNKELVAKYGIPEKHGVPALAILDSTGKILFSDVNREFQSARSMDPEDLITFLNKWKPKA
jgi:thioredoxin 1